MDYYIVLVFVLIGASAIILFVFHYAIIQRGIYLYGKIKQRIQINNKVFILIVGENEQEYPIILKTTRGIKYNFSCGDIVGLSVYKFLYFYRCDLSNTVGITKNLIVYE